MFVSQSVYVSKSSLAFKYPDDHYNYFRFYSNSFSEWKKLTTETHRFLGFPWGCEIGNFKQNPSSESYTKHTVSADKGHRSIMGMILEFLINREKMKACFVNWSISTQVFKANIV